MRAVKRFVADAARGRGPQAPLPSIWYGARGSAFDTLHARKLMQGRVFGILVLAAMIWRVAEHAAGRRPAGRGAGRCAGPRSAAHQATLQQVLRHLSQPAAEDRRPGARSARHRATSADDAETWEKVVRKLRVGAMPPRGARRPDSATTDALIAWLEGELDRHGTSNPGPAGAAPAESRRIRQRDPRSARARRGRHVAAAARRRGVRLRQRRRRAGQLAGAAAGLSGRGAQDQRGRGRRFAHRRRQRHLHRAAGSVAGRAPRRTAARHRRRDARRRTRFRSTASTSSRSGSIART